MFAFVYRSKFGISLCALATLTASSTAVMAATAYVSPTGTGSTCSRGTPCSFASGLNKAGNRGTIYLVTTGSNNFGNLSIPNSVMILGTNQTIRANFTIAPTNNTPIQVLIKGVEIIPGTTTSPGIRVSSISNQTVNFTLQDSSVRGFSSSSGGNIGMGLYSSGNGINNVTIINSNFTNNYFNIVNYSTNTNSTVQAYHVTTSNSSGSNGGLVNANPAQLATNSPSTMIVSASQIFDGTSGPIEVTD